MNLKTGTSFSPESNSRPGRNRWQLAIKLLVGVSLIALVISLIDFQELIAIVHNANPWYLLTLVALFFLDRALMAYKWERLLQVVGIRLPFLHLYQIYIIVPLSGTVLPSTIGGDLFRLYSLSKYNIGKKSALASMAVERLIALVISLLLASFGMALAFYLMKENWSQFKGIGWVIAVGAVVIIGLPIGVTRPIFRRGISSLVGKLSRYSTIGILVAKLREIYALCYGYQEYPSTIVTVAGWTLLEQMAPILENFLMVHALHIDVSPLELIAIVPLIVLAVRLPISLDGLGVQEGLYVGLFALVGVSASEAFLLSLISRVLPLLSALPWGVHYIFKSQRDISLADKSPS